ncbi:MAG: linear amide C-N hydrolase [Candidatus Cryptobacteroides sp.]
MANTDFSAKLKAMLTLGALASAMILTSCCDKNGPTQTSNPAGLIDDPAKLEMLHSLVDLEGNKGRLYEMTYTVDYKLDEALNAGIVGQNSLIQFAMTHLMDHSSSKAPTLRYDAGCSAFACTDKNDFLMGRNFDFNHKNEKGERIMIPAIVVHTAPKGGKKSVSFVDGQFVYLESGFYTDGESDLSILMALPYLLLDGINEDGFAISVLKLDGEPTRQHYSDRKNIFTTVAMRMLLDRASTVEEATQMLDQYNMCMDDDPASYHFFMADATGDYAIVEYTFEEGEKYPTRMEVLRGDDVWRYVTNFYASPSMIDSPHGSVISTHGKWRYDTLKVNLAKYQYKLDPAQAMSLLEKVAQGPDDEEQRSTGFTQWSEVFNLSKRTVRMSILREFDKTFNFTIE